MTTATVALATRTLSTARHRNRYRDASTEAIHAEAESWLWDLAEIETDLEADPASWAWPEETKAFVLFGLEEAD